MARSSGTPTRKVAKRVATALSKLPTACASPRKATPTSKRAAASSSIAAPLSAARRRPAPLSETLIQQELVRKVRIAVAQHPELVGLNWLFAVPNGDLRSKSVALRLQREGVRKGVSDLILLLPMGGYHGLLMEMKTATGPIRPEQVTFLSDHADRGYACCVRRSVADALDTLIKYATTGAFNA